MRKLLAFITVLAVLTVWALGFPYLIHGLVWVLLRAYALW